MVDAEVAAWTNTRPHRAVRAEKATRSWWAWR